MQELKPDIYLHIDRLILDGLDLRFAQRADLQTAIETELARLLAEDGLGSSWQSGGAAPSVSASAIQHSSDDSPTKLGQQIAQAVYGGIGDVR